MKEPAFFTRNVLIYGYTKERRELYRPYRTENSPKCSESRMHEISVETKSR